MGKMMADDGEDLIRAGVQPRHGWLVRSVRRAFWPLVRAWFLHEHDNISLLRRQIHDLASQVSLMRDRADQAEEHARRALDVLERSRDQITSEIVGLDTALRAICDKVTTFEDAFREIGSRLTIIEEEMQEYFLSSQSTQQLTFHNNVKDKIYFLEKNISIVMYDISLIRSRIIENKKQIDGFGTDIKANFYQCNQAEMHMKKEIVALVNVVSNIRSLIESNISAREL